MTNSTCLRVLARLSAALLVTTGLLPGIMTSSALAASKEVNIYSFRQPYLIKPLLKAFTKKTGVHVNVLFAKKGLIERLAAEGRNSPADIVLTSDIGRLTGAVARGVTQSVTSDILQRQIPAAFRDKNNHWFGLTKRARVVYASKTRVKQNAITLEELADPKWRGRICIRSGQQVYNIALFASMIVHHGKTKAKTWLRGLKANLARKPAGSDRNQIKGVYEGVCDIAIANTYYMASMQRNKKKPIQREWAASVKLLFPNAGDRGSHVNLSGMVLAKHAPNRANAIALMEFLVSDEAQGIYAAVNHEYPVTPGVASSKLVSSWGQLNADPLGMDAIADQRHAASIMVDVVGFNNGAGS